MSNIFIKNNKSQIILVEEELLSLIPKEATNYQNIELAKIMVEWRWRIFDIPGKKNKMVEISYQNVKNPRMYMDKYGKWVERVVSDEFDKYVVQSYYCYTDSD
jgi:hypothetical protein